MMRGPSESMSIFSRRGTLVVLLAWIAILGFDLFLHGALLAGLYLRPSPFLLPPLEAFRRIPVGYLSFLVAAAFLVWMLSALGARGARKGLQLGAGLGAALWGSLGLGLYSISTASPVLLISWAVGQTVEMAYAGAIVGWAFAEGSLKKPYLAVLAATIVLVILTIAAQSSGLAPVVRSR